MVNGLSTEDSEQDLFQWESGDTVFSDEELTELAMASSLDQPMDPDAVPLSVYLAQMPSLLPGWYMPAVTSRGGKAWKIAVVFLILATFIFIDASGLCSTYGSVVPV